MFATKFYLKQDYHFLLFAQIFCQLHHQQSLRRSHFQDIILFIVADGGRPLNIIRDAVSDAHVVYI